MEHLIFAFLGHLDGLKKHDTFVTFAVKPLTVITLSLNPQPCPSYTSF
ncbi:hypothetical protein KSK37_08430 [Kaistella sp. DKR-2]|nr:hypothetical protein [Kaistella soli]MBU8883106.1 hypothetical protein [Kaistella soli]